MDSATDSHAIRPVILAGGGGTRLWPLSRGARPKHLLPLLSEQSLFDGTVERVSDRSRYNSPLILCGIGHVAGIAEALRGHDDAILLVEPSRRDTAAAIALAAHAAGASDELLLILPSDHHIADRAAFDAAVDRGQGAALAGRIVTFGIEPTGPETGFGYIEAGEPIGGGVFAVERFVEKPDLATAQALVADGRHSWNAGIFLARADVLLGELTKHSPAIGQAVAAAFAGASHDGGRIIPEADAFARTPALSIDYAVMEKSDRVAVVPASFGWSDIGNWDALYDAAAKDADGNSIVAGSTVIDGGGCLVRSDGPRIAAIGVDGLVIVATAEAVLVMPRALAQRAREAAAWFETEDGNGQQTPAGE